MRGALTLSTLFFLIFGWTISAFALGYEANNLFMVRWADIDNRDFNDDLDDHQNYFTQLLESVGQYEPVLGYSLGWKVKVSNGVWGYDFGQDAAGPESTNEDAELTIEALYARVNQDYFGFTIGLTPVEVGNAWVLQSDGVTGAAVQLRPIAGWSFDLIFAILDENDLDDYDPTVYYQATDDGATTVNDEDGNEDENLYGLQLGKKLDEGQANIYWAAMVNRENTANYGGLGTEGNVNAVGISGNYMVGPVRLEGEATTFFGEDEVNDSDFVGNQIHLGGTYNFQSGNIQTNLYYAKSADADETQVTNIIKLGKVQPFQQGLGPILDHNDDDLKILPKPISVFEVAPNSGVVGIGINGAYKPYPPLTLTAGLIYLTPEDEDASLTEGLGGDYASWTSLTTLNLGINYQFNKNFMTGIGASYKTWSTDDTGELDDAMGVVGMVTFFF